MLPALRRAAGWSCPERDRNILKRAEPGRAAAATPGRECECAGERGSSNGNATTPDTPDTPVERLLTDSCSFPTQCGCGRWRPLPEVRGVATRSALRQVGTVARRGRVGVNLMPPPLYVWQ